MDKLQMRTPNMADKNFSTLAEMFPNAVTETIDENGNTVRAIDKDALLQEISCTVIEGPKERYQFTWPNKRQAGHLANTPTTMTLRPCREESVDFDRTKNLYIEGDNLEVLKVLRETYLGKVKMIYIDPPYNTGNDFVYNDEFAQKKEEFEINSGLFDDEGNQTVNPMVRNTETQGRFHTNWLNMIYPRLKVARDLLTEDGVIFISIDDSEQENLRKVCNEIFGEKNFICQFVWKSKLGKVGTTSTIASTHEYIICYSKNSQKTEFKMIVSENEGRKENLRQWGQADRREDRPSMFYPITINGEEVFPIKDDGSEGRWRVGKEMAKELLEKGLLELSVKNGIKNIYRIFEKGVSITPYETLLSEIGTTAKGAQLLRKLEMNKVFDYSKPVELITFFTDLCKSQNSIILDFFSGSATTAHAVMKLNAEDGGNRKFIMIQLPEVTDEKSEAHKAGYRNICEIGKERIRRAGKKIKEEASVVDQNLDIGFRVLKLDSSNMKDVYYSPENFNEDSLFSENIKEGRTNEDLLFQTMLDLGVELSAKIEVQQINGKTVHFIDNNFLITCFDTDVNESTITELAKLKPVYFVMRDASAANDNVIDNFEQLFKHYSPNTVCRVI